MEGYYNRGILYDNSNNFNEIEKCPDIPDFHKVGFEYNNISFYSAKFGAGYQYFITPWLTAALSMSLDVNTLAVQNDRHVREVVNGVEYKIGSNLAEGFFESDASYDNSKDFTRTGVSAFLEIGVMFF